MIGWPETSPDESFAEVYVDPTETRRDADDSPDEAHKNQ